MRKPTEEEIIEARKYDAFQKHLYQTSKQNLIDRAGSFYELLPPYLLLSTEAKLGHELGSAIFDANEYQRLTKAYYEHQLDRIFIQTRTPGDCADPINLSWKISDDPDFFAYANADSGRAEIEISIGTIHALQDLAWRAVSSENFFSVRPYDHRQHAAVSRFLCYEPESPWVPKHRYLDYTPQENDTPETREYLEYARAHGIEPDVTTLFYRKLPMSKERLALAHAMVKIALTWMFCHEEAHLRLGHLSPEFTDNWREQHCVAMEWQADRSACMKVLSIFLEDNTALSFLHSDLATSHVWRLRLISSSVGLAVSLLDRDHLFQGASEEHPPAKLRLVQLMRQTIRIFEDDFEALQKHEFETSLGVMVELARFDGPLGRSYHLIEGALWDVFSVLELLDIEVKIRDRASEHIMLDNDAGSHVLALAIAWRIDGKLSLNGGRIDLLSHEDKRFLAGFFLELSERYSVPMKKIMEMWHYSCDLWREFDEITIKTNEIVEEISQISRKLAVRNIFLR